MRFCWYIGVQAAVLLGVASWCGCRSESVPKGPPAPEVAVVETRPGWVQVDPAGAAKLLGAGEVIILDVRTPAEFSVGHLAGATNLDFTAKGFGDRVAELDRDQPYLMYCRSGSRSGRALLVLEELGFSSVAHLDGGVLAWKKAGGQLEK